MKSNFKRLGVWNEMAEPIYGRRMRTKERQFSKRMAENFPEWIHPLIQEYMAPSKINKEASCWSQSR